MNSAVERRLVSRYPMQFAGSICDARDNARSTKKRRQALVKNMSSKGVLLASGVLLHLGQQVAITIKIGENFPPPYSCDLELEGRVVRKEEVPGDRLINYAILFEGQPLFIGPV